MKPELTPSELELRFASTPSLDIAYEQTGPDAGEPILLLHGFPYDVRSYDEVRRGLAGVGARLIVPYLRGFGPTRYRSAGLMRNGQQAALAQDLVDLFDALEIERALLVGYDWGGRAACAVAALWTHRVRALVTIGGYAIQDIAKNHGAPMSPEAVHARWYQWYFQTEQGRVGLEQNREALCKKCWQVWSPTWPWDEALFRATAKSFGNPDFVDTVLHAYRHRFGNVPGDPALESLEARLAGKPPIAVPTIALHGGDDGVYPPSASERQEALYTGGYERTVLPGIGHGVPQEAPDAVVHAVMNLLRNTK